MKFFAIIIALALPVIAMAQTSGPYVTMPGQSVTPIPEPINNLGHVLVTASGYSTPSGWIVDTANPLQDAFNYYTNFVGPNALIQSGMNDNDTVINQNPIAPGFEVVGTLYAHPGFKVPSFYLNTSWELYGDGPLYSALIGDSNVVMCLTNGMIGVNGASGTHFSMHDLAIVWSNETSKAVAAYPPGIGAYDEIYDNVFVPYSLYNANNGNSTLPEGGSRWNGGTTTCPAVVALFVDGSFGQQSIHDNVFDAPAVGIVSVSGHTRVFNNEFDDVGIFIGASHTNFYATNDASSYFGYNQVLGSDLSVGANVLLYQDDDSCIGDKSLAGRVDVAIKGAGGQAFGGVYGPVILQNEHDEALLAAGFDVLFLNSSGKPGMVRAHDCFRQSVGDESFVVGYQVPGNAAWSADTIADTNQCIDDSFSQVTGQVEWKINNTQINPMFYFSTNFFGTMVNGGTLRYTNKPPYCYAAPN